MTKEAASGVDGVTFQEYEKHLEANLVERLKRKSYHARLVRRKYIHIGNGKLRPLGIGYGGGHPALSEERGDLPVGRQDIR